MSHMLFLVSVKNCSVIPNSVKSICFRQSCCDSGLVLCLTYKYMHRIDVECGQDAGLLETTTCFPHVLHA